MRLDAEFVSSALAMDQCPRCNVGKSSLLNALTGQSQLARTSKTPGRTRCLNFFTVGNKLALVDLPGYGYAKMGHADAARIGALMQDYLHNRSNLDALVILVDARRGPEHEEVELSELCEQLNLEPIVAATKSDKLRRSERAVARARFEAMGIEPMMCSASDGEGIEELRRRILAIGQSNRRRVKRR
jgi:GTP-binding protein